jgi:glycosyltransferase involved in cell wall biosynthesis
MNSRDNQDVSVVILTKNSAETLEKCLASVEAEKPFEIIAVDGRSTDGTLSILKGHRIKVLSETEESYGYGYSRQLGVNAAKSPYVMFVDSDVELCRGCITTLREALEEFGWVGVHAKLLSSENCTYWQKSVDEGYLRFYGHTGPTNQIDTIVALFRRQALITHPFDITFKEAAEDVDISRRLIKSGYQLGISNATAYHLHRREFSAFLRQHIRNGYGRARLWLKYREHAILPSPLVIAGSQVIRSLARGNLRRIPYFVAGGVIGQIGIIMGVQKVRSESPPHSHVEFTETN